MIRATSKGFRLHIGFFGRRNVGKSSLLNAMTQQKVSIVSDVAGTTTDPVEKPMELLPIGPVLFIDTAGVDDVGALGAQRIEKTRKVIERTDIGVLVIESGIWTDFEEKLLAELRAEDSRSGCLEQDGSATSHDRALDPIRAGEPPLCKTRCNHWSRNGQIPR